MGVSLALVWGNQLAMIIFGIQLILNILWSYLFFGLKSPFYGLIDIFFFGWQLFRRLSFFGVCR